MCEYNVYAQCVQLGMPRSRFIPLEGRLMNCRMNCRHGLPLQHSRWFLFLLSPILLENLSRYKKDLANLNIHIEMLLVDIVVSLIKI